METQKRCFLYQRIKGQKIILREDLVDQIFVKHISFIWNRWDEEVLRLHNLLDDLN